MYQLPIFVLGGCAALFIEKMLKKDLTNSVNSETNKKEVKNNADVNTKKTNSFSSNGDSGSGDNSQTRTNENSIEE